MTTRLDHNTIAYNATVDAINEVDQKIAELARERDNAWVAAESFMGQGRHGAAHLPRNIKITNGLVQR